MRFSDKLKNLRAKHSLSQEGMAKKIGMSPSAISSWENNVRSPKIGQIMKIAKAFDMDWLDLVDDKEHFISLQKNEEQTLLNSFHSINEEGQRMLLTFAQSLVYNPLYGNGKGTMKDAFLYDGARNQKTLEDIIEEGNPIGSPSPTKEKK